MPGEQALEALKRLDKDMSVFKIPSTRSVKKKKSKVKVLDEDTYVEEMAKIIQRDFFPDLEKLQAQNEFLDATERKDRQKLRELFIKYSSGHRPPTERYASPATFETPSSEMPSTPREVFEETPHSTNQVKIRDNSRVDGQDKKEKISSKHSLDSYLAMYTSEDNHSFQNLMEEMGRRCRAKFAGQLKEEEESQLRILAGCVVPSIEEQANQTKPDELETWSYRAKNYIMYVPDGHVSEGDIPKYRQEVVHNNTRMEGDPFDHQRSKEVISQIARNQERILSGRIDVDGSTLLDAKKRELSKPGLLGSGSQNTNNDSNNLLSLVRTPSPCPGAPGESPLMTWGEIEGTPFRLDGGDTPLPHKAAGAAFKMASVPKREQLALALAEKAGQRHRDMKQKAIEAAKRSMLSPSPRMATGSVTDRLASMSPAAQRLATHHLKRPIIGASPSPKMSSVRTPKSLTPLSFRSHRRTPVLVSNKVNTPNMAKRKPVEVSSTGNVGNQEGDKKRNDLTDDLLQINLPKRRLKASDFFK